MLKVLFRRKSRYEGRSLMRIEMPTASKEKAHKAQRERRCFNARRTKPQKGRVVERNPRRKEEKVAMNVRQSWEGTHGGNAVPKAWA